MAEIEMERRRRGGIGKWIVLLLILAAVAVGVWLLMGGEVRVEDGEPAAETTGTTVVPEPDLEPVTPLEEPPTGDEGLPHGGSVPEGSGEAGPAGAEPGVEPGVETPGGQDASDRPLSLTL